MSAAAFVSFTNRYYESPDIFVKIANNMKLTSTQYIRRRNDRSLLEWFD